MFQSWFLVVGCGQKVVMKFRSSERRQIGSMVGWLLSNFLKCSQMAVEWEDRHGRLNLKDPVPRAMNTRLGRCHGTTTAGIIVPDFMLMASDGMLSLPLSSSGRHYERISFDRCKLHEVSDFCGAWAGDMNFLNRMKVFTRSV
ncbi:hypothetical protein MKX03_018413 [Papaver bracteatum]|nr:hypothetical protein MKX03_018413 [Papaver bracteatum]